MVQFALNAIFVPSGEITGLATPPAPDTLITTVAVPYAFVNPISAGEYLATKTKGGFCGTDAPDARSAMRGVVEAAITTPAPRVSSERLQVALFIYQS